MKMANRRATRNELRLCFNRFLNDTKDDFFPDPIRYKDLSIIKEEIVYHLQQTINNTINQPRVIYPVKQHYPGDVPKSNFVIRQGCSFHPYDMIVFHFILNRLVPVIEPILTKARYSYRIHNHRDVELFNRPPTKNWLDFKTDIKAFFNENSEYNYLVSTDVAGFFEYIQLQHFKRQLLNLTRNEEKQTIELLNSMLKEFHRGSVSGIPQNCDPFSYLCTAFLHYLDKELEIRGSGRSEGDWFY